MSEKRSSQRTLIGRVAGTAMEKTMVVVVERKEKHPLYGKYVRRRTRLLVHDEDNRCKSGDTVLIEASRPLSKRKAWRLREILSSAEQLSGA